MIDQGCASGLEGAAKSSTAGLLPAYVCQPAVAVGRLVELLPGWEIPPYEMMLIFPNLKNQSKAQAAFRDYVKTFDFSVFGVGRN
ncbi:LysR substrate-binding domain-containing protein [Mesorhizobium sp. M1338]|uniref:LysR substrate-binding domain-containing protein n=1 Tax=Mesorhizobium sp. M1338 TaxID=2957085 RepID=UPI00333DC71F